MKVIVVIPARFKSSRFEGKPLVNLLGKPMILWVAELSAKAVGDDCVYVATDDERIKSVVEEAGFNAVMTSENCLTGTDRLSEFASKVEADIYVNVQGDEPLVDPEDIRKIVDFKKNNMSSIVNGFCYLTEQEEPSSLNIPKVVTTEKNRLLYMSRSVVPGFKDSNNSPSKFKKQVCIYAFSRADLTEFSRFGRKSEVESYEDIEILRFLEFDKKIVMVETSNGSLAVDVPSDVPPVELALKRLHNL